jgi:gas vesicle protein
MSTQNRSRPDSIDSWPPRAEGGRGHLGPLFLATLLGVGVGLLAAPQPGSDTRRVLRKRLAALGEDLGEELEGLEEKSRPARRAMRKRAEELRRRGRKKWEAAMEELDHLDADVEDEADEDGGHGVLGTFLTLGAGIAAAYLLTSERAAPARERVREAAATVRDEAEARWDQFQRRRGNGQPTTESGTRIDPADSAPQAS